MRQSLTGAQLPWERCRAQEGTAAQSPACPHGGGIPSSTQGCHQPQHHTLQPLGSHQSSATLMWMAQHSWVPSALSLPTIPFPGWRQWDGSVLGARYLLAPRAQPRDSLTPAVPAGSGDKVLAQPPTPLSPSGAVSHPKAPQSRSCLLETPPTRDRSQSLCSPVLAPGNGKTQRRALSAAVPPLAIARTQRPFVAGLKISSALAALETCFIEAGGVKGDGALLWCAARTEDQGKGLVAVCIPPGLAPAPPCTPGCCVGAVGIICHQCPVGQQRAVHGAGLAPNQASSPLC